MKSTRGAVGIVLILVLLIATATPAAAAATSTNYPLIRNVPWVNVLVRGTVNGGVFGLGHIGLDVMMTSSALNGGQPYNPCHNPAESTGCSDGTQPIAYYKVFNYDLQGNNFPHGMFIDNSNNGYIHNWAKKITGAAFEIYPHSNTPNGYRYSLDPINNDTYGGRRGALSGFPHIANGGAYSADAGTIYMPKWADADVVRLNGFVTKNGARVGSGAVDTAWFGNKVFTNRSSTGFGLTAFAAWPTNQDGYYTSGPLAGGPQNVTVYFTEKATGKTLRCTIYIASRYERLDLNLNDAYFGLGSRPLLHRLTGDPQQPANNPPCDPASFWTRTSEGQDEAGSMFPVSATTAPGST